MRCQICPATLADGPLYRYNEKGVPGIWRCSQHRGFGVDKAVVRIAEIVHQAGKTGA
jgi:hypothetical protein